MFIAILVLLLALIFIVPAVRANGARARSRAVHAGVIALGDVTQHTYADVVARLGNPSSISAVGAGNRLVQWVLPNYHVAMTFDATDRCLGIDHEGIA